MWRMGWGVMFGGVIGGRGIRIVYEEGGGG